MCKVIVFTSFAKVKNQDRVTTELGNLLLSHERDGFGYAIQGRNGVFGEKIAGPRKFTSRYGIAKSEFVKAPIFEARHILFGEKTKAVGPALFHGRTSTNDSSVVNCHPMQRDGWNLIHNGVVTDHGKPYIKFTKNDSEDVLYRLIQGVSEVETHLSGYYAFAAIDPKNRLHVARDSQATLFVSWFDSIDSHVIATTEELIQKVASILKMQAGPIEKMTEDSYIIFDGNSVIHNQKIKPRGYTSYEASYAKDSLGRSLDSFGTASNIVRAYDVDTGDEDEELMRELDNLDDSYTILDESDQIITAYQYERLDPVAQAGCMITREDGSVIPPYYVSNGRKSYG